LFCFTPVFYSINPFASFIATFLSSIPQLVNTVLNSMANVMQDKFITHGNSVFNIMAEAKGSRKVKRLALSDITDIYL
jgi:hypothetical protein